MSTIIQIKRSEGSTAPTTTQLAEAELAYTQDKTNDGASAKLYIESLNNAGLSVIHAIGGKYFTDIIDAATDANTASKLVKRDASGNFAAGTITAALTGNASTATTLQTARNIGGVSFNGSANIDLPGVNTTGNQNTTGSAATLTTGRTIAITGDLAYTSESFNGSGNVTGAGTLATVNTNVGTFGSTTAIPVITVNAKGLVTSVTTDSITTSFNIAGGSGSPVSIAGGSTLTFAGTANEIETTITAGQVQIGLPNDVTIGQNLTVTGNLTVNGTTTTIATTNTVVSDLLLELGNGVTGSPSSDAGIIIERGTSNNAFMGFDESEDKFIVGTGTFTGASTGNLTITVGTLLANLESSNVTITGGSITGITDITVADGGTGASTFTTNGVIFGNGTSALGVTAAGTAGQVLVSGGSGSAPSFANIDGGTF
jgi:hypothetical protein